MAIQLGSAYGKVAIDSSGVQSGVTSAQKVLSGFSSFVKFGLTAALGLATVAIAGVTTQIYDSVQAAAEAQDVQAQLGAVLESTGGVAGVTADQVNEMADALSNVTKFDDEAIISGESVLLTFTNIGKNVFPQATETMLDMSEALGQDLKSSAIQLGKALQDPIDGVTALRRVGVNFSDEQQKVIKALVDAGKLEEAQAMILKELQTEFGGSARAAGETFAGKLQILKNQLGNVKESIGTALLPVLTDLATTLSKKLSSPEAQAFITKIGQGLAKFAQTAIDYLPIAVEWLGKAFTWAKDNLSPILTAVATKIGEFVGIVKSKMPDVVDGLRNAFDWLMQNKGVIVGALAAIGAVLLSAVVSSVVAAVSAAAPLIAVMAAIGAVAYVLYRAWTENWGGIQQKVQAFVTWFQTVLVPNIRLAFQFVQGIFQAGMEFIHNLTSGKLGALSTIWNNTMTMIGTIINNGIVIVKAIFNAFAAAFRGDWTTFGQQLRVAWDTLWKTFGTIIRTAWTNIKTALSALIKNVTNYFKTIDWKEVGKNIVQGIANGITNATSWAIKAIMGLASAVINAIKGFLGISSPAKLPEIQVGMPIGQGIGVGIRRSIANLRREMPGIMNGLVSPRFAMAAGAASSSRDMSSAQEWNQRVMIYNASFNSPGDMRQGNWLRRFEG